MVIKKTIFKDFLIYNILRWLLLMSVSIVNIKQT